MSQEDQIGGMIEPFGVEDALDVAPLFILYLGSETIPFGISTVASFVSASDPNRKYRK